MTWPQAVIIGLCGLNFLTLIGLWFKGVKLAKPVNLARGLKPTQSIQPIPPDPLYPLPKPKDESVILMTPDRDSRILEDEDG